ncbi:MAG: response regulator [Hydrogenophaga sp.]|uniref:response regulator n=1 Tax=Hydrogenophaga sp. TaxID=1904254 RepID=UPI00261520F1|nr:response regulator [Hydrogenophaga sp.]MCV0438521.1 response regulator [Hydrogenophaga sp.]
MNVGVTKPHVLCVDDDPNVLRALQWLLRSQFTVSTTTDPQEGLARLRGLPFEVVISDHRMPGMPGTEFLQQARIESPNTMRLLLTGFSDFTDVMDSVNASEVFRFIQKPWDNQVLLDTIAYAALVARHLPLDGSAGVFRTKKGSDIQVTGDEIVLLLDPDPLSEQQLRKALGEDMVMCWARDMAEAADLLTHHRVAVLLLETHVGPAPTLDLIRAVKRSQPEIVPMVLSAERDSHAIRRLINEGQIYRFLGKPVGPRYARRMVRAALAKHRELLAHPLRAARHAVQDPLPPGHGRAGAPASPAQR